MDHHDVRRLAAATHLCTQLAVRLPQLTATSAATDGSDRDRQLARVRAALAGQVSRPQRRVRTGAPPSMLQDDVMHTSLF
ncbi:hypothetical protein [Paraburkholderia mimosarum]|uniref:hypothetical protein n=1 Tax=Paraburkholderia mimosarum TaxID=312026 RepID=UPI001AE03AF6|nr:hypothetical protein [Paraburkholderia mimosarum]